MATSRFNVQVRIGPNGETIVDEESLFVDRAEEHETDNYVHVEESDATKFVNSGSYSKKFRGTRWTAEETDLFYAVSPFSSSLPGKVITPGRPFLNLVRTMN
jgi:transcription factor TFIIIB component B''